jgi:hypothetical protein
MSDRQPSFRRMSISVDVLMLYLSVRLIMSLAISSAASRLVVSSG